jgi:hypothetical protein
MHSVSMDGVGVHDLVMQDFGVWAGTVWLCMALFFNFMVVHGVETSTVS